GGPGIDSPVPDGGGEAVIAEADPPATEDSDIGPRMVRTVVGKPDGTIVSSEATGGDDEGKALPQPEGRAVAVALPEPDRSEMDSVLEGGDLAVNPNPLGDPAEQEPVAAEPPPAPEVEAEPIPAPPAEAEAETPPAMRALPTPQPEPVAAAP